MGILEIILAIILPPLAVLLRYGLSGKFLINLLLTILGYIPGLIHALYIMSQDGKQS
ncbi:MAG: YqaE/Pmp3 family membrane protein [Bacteroidetes bacterium]|nr:MAG: YqaE/Pmp3 family membrane protein [Bacteroidota bacterium]